MIQNKSYSADQSCVLCNSAVGYQKKFNRFEKDNRSYEIIICPGCRLWITQPFPDQEHLDSLYSTNNYRKHHSRFVLPAEKIVEFFRKLRCRRIKNLFYKGRILDIGCARGLFLSLMREEGWKTFGLELNDNTAHHARNVIGLDVKSGNLSDAHFGVQSFDVITIWHVLEHLSDPILTINECNRILKKGGKLVIAVPNTESLQAKISGRFWFHLDIPYHLYHFNVRNLRLLLGRFSFKINKIRHFSFEFNPFGYLQSFLNISRIEHNLLYNLLKTKSIRKSLLSRTRRSKFIMHLSLTAILTPFFIPLSLILAVIEAVMRHGGTIEVYATKRDDD
ncbi:MAG: hypothetical protein A2Y97_13230 [Nitrospirae bacterium RBG_13_39_12]|nr:MAG: hypothetical protein A2Y97_13230 [Nitrospirae bacterium RBG_13_39_12]